MGKPDLVARAIGVMSPSKGDLAKLLGLSYDCVRSWSIGRTNPNEENRKKLADLLDTQAHLLRQLAMELRRST